MRSLTISQYTGIVVIGRNEGERLERCLRSALYHAKRTVYVDSGSSDDSVGYARSTGVEVIQLDSSIPFSAGRARNEGFWHLTNSDEGLKYIHFIDGDTELCDGWLDFAEAHLERNPNWAIVSGRRLERYPENSVYNLLCDIEWNSPIGEATSCGGDFLVRVSAFVDVAGFNRIVVSGEEPELCYRMRTKDWRIFRLDHPMTLHDANMRSFSQWWKRAIRSGHGYAQGYALHGREAEKYCLRDSLRIWFWAFLFPVLTFLSSGTYHSLWLLLFLLYPIHLLRIAINVNRRTSNWKRSLVYSLYNIIGKWPQLYGQLVFLIRSVSNTDPTIIEYK